MMRYFGRFLLKRICGPSDPAGPAVTGRSTAAEMRSLRLASCRGRRLSPASSRRFNSARSTLACLKAGLPLLRECLGAFHRVFGPAQRSREEGFETQPAGDDLARLFVEHGRHLHYLRMADGRSPSPCSGEGRVRGWAYTKRHETEPMRVKEARTASPTLGRKTLEMEPVRTTSPTRILPPRRPRALASQVSELSGLPMTSAAVAVATRCPFSSYTTPSSDRSSPLTGVSGPPSTMALA